MARITAETDRIEDAATQRVRVGALGLAGVFLLVMLATALLRATTETEVGNVAANAVSNAAAPSEPLAQLGVAPGNAPQDTLATPVRAGSRAPR